MSAAIQEAASAPKLQKSANAKTDWAAFNTMQRISAEQFARGSGPLHMIIASIVLEPQAKLLGTLEEVGSDEWETKMLANTLRGDGAYTRIQDLSKL